jgi:hypothetical protein
MSIELSNSSSNAMLDALGREMDGGRLELLDNQSHVLAVLQLSNPSALPASDGELVFADITEDIAPATGTAVSARVVSAGGAEVFSCDCGTEDSAAVIRLGTILITAGAPVRIDAFTLRMP